MDDSDLISAEVDFGNVRGYFVRLDIELPRSTLYTAGRDAGGPMGYLALSADEAEELAAELRERAARVRALST